MGPPPNPFTAVGPDDSAPTGVIYVYLQSLDLREWVERLFGSANLRIESFHSFESLLMACMSQAPAVLFVDRSTVVSSLLTWQIELHDADILVTRHALHSSYPVYLLGNTRRVPDPYELSGN